MIFSQDPRKLRQMYVDAWTSHQAGKTLSGLEKQIANVVNDHPEYQAMMCDAAIDASFTVENGQSNPFLHMGLHLALRDQLATDRPAGIRNAFDRLLTQSKSRHDAEHQAIDCLAEALWEAQSQQRPPDEQAYLKRLQTLT